MNRIEKKFKELKRRKKKAFIIFVTAGYPDLNATEKLCREFSRNGVDIIELGVPFSDPMADGPVIQASSEAALKKNTHLVDILKCVKRLRKSIDTPICLMTYYNPVFCFGEKEFVKKAKESGVDGVIIPDLPPEEGSTFIRLADKSGIDVICFLSPTTTRQRLKFICSKAKGFLYYVSLTGVTGARRNLPRDLAANIRSIKRYTKKPVCVGFGVSSAGQVRAVQKIADGVIVGSAIVKKIKDNLGKPDLTGRVSAFVRSLQR
jgi:tryptophan synthase alpha chain